MVPMKPERRVEAARARFHSVSSFVAITPAIRYMLHLGYELLPRPYPSRVPATHGMESWRLPPSTEVASGCHKVAGRVVMSFMKLQNMRVMVCAGLALLTAEAVFGQTPAVPPAFEVASVKPAPPPTPGSINVRTGGDPGMVDYKNVALRTVIARAYRMKEYQISGPDWIETARFDILAKVPPNAPKGQIPLMLQNLLAERFKLTVHREQKVMPVYAMVVGKGGLKVKPLEGDPEGSMRNMFSPKGRAFSGQMTLAALVAALSQMLDRPVVDLSGVKGTYDIDLEWVPDEHESSALTKM